MSGIWPPDVGGPASHAPDAVEYLRGRGHAVEVVVTADRAPAPVPYPVHWISRRIPVGARHVAAAALIARRARRADVVYTTGMYTRSAAGAWLARRPYVVKLTGDPAFERARRFDGARGFDRFQQAPGGPVARALRLARDVSLRRAAHVFCPSAWLRELVVSWGVPAQRASVLPNPAPEPDGLPTRAELRSRLGFAGPTAAWAGRLTAQKSLEVAFAAVAQAGDRVRFVGPRAARGCWRSSPRPT